MSLSVKILVRGVLELIVSVYCFCKIAKSFFVWLSINLNFASQSLNNPNLTLVPIYLPLTIYPHFGFTTGDSINLSIQFINVNSQSFLQTGGGVVIIWPSSVGPITADTSFTPIYITNTNTSIVEELVNEKLNGKIIDILGREIYDYNNLPKGSIYIRNGKKFIIQKD